MAYAQPVTTSATIAQDADLREAAAAFLADDPATLTFERCKGGVNNKCYYLTRADGTRYLIRLYNNGRNTPRVQWEHEVLRALESAHLPFQLPKLVPVKGGSGETFALLADGSAACMFVAIPGGGAPLSAARNIGKATAQLVKAMAALPPLPGAASCPNPLYRNPYDAHHATAKGGRDSFLAQMRDAAFDGVREHADFLTAEVLRMEQQVTQLAAAGQLPEQLIHADLHFDNVLCTGDEVSGLLDFEFSAHDWRVMEAVVGLSKYIALPDIEPVFEAWVSGYAAAGGRLLPVEVDLIPDLIIARVLNNVVYFAGRIMSGEDCADVLTSRCAMYRKRVEWIRERKEWMLSVLRRELLQA